MAGAFSLLAVAVVGLLVTASPSQGFSVQLKHLSTVYLPHAPGSRSSDTPQYGFDRDAVEKSVYDLAEKMIYSVGASTLHVINASNPMDLTLVDTIFNTSREFTDVALCSGSVFATYIDKTNLLEGGVIQYRRYDQQQKVIPFVRSISIGSQPDNLLPTRSCTLVVALENPLVEDNGQRQDPPGGVGIIRFPGGDTTREPTVITLDFTPFDSRFQELARSGVRWVYRGDNNKFSNDVEPEYVTFNADQTKAYVCLQENNAIAVVDLQNGRITDIYGLGFKNWAQSKLDPSDKDGGVQMASWDVYGMYQPDGIQWFRWEGHDYIVTANEGSSKSSQDFEEDRRGKSFPASEMADSVSSEMESALQDDAKLGRLKFSKVDGKNQQGKFERFYTFGARSFSIWDASNMSLVFDSGRELGEKTAELRQELFNNRIDDEDSTVASGMDKRSDDKGVEPESVAVAESGGRLLLFVGLEKPGSIAVYSVAPKGGMAPRFESLYTDGIPTGGKTWKQMYQEGKLHALDPESLSVIDKDSGLADFPILMVTGTVSGTVSLLKVDITDTTGSATTAGPVLSLLWSCLLLVGTLLVLRK